MKRFIRLFVLIGIVFILTGCDINSNKKYMKEISYKEYHELLDNKETFILEIMRTDCSACISFKPNIQKVTKDYKVEVKYINTDNITEEEKEALYQETGISGTPTVIFYTEGVEKTKASRINGSVSEEKIISKFKANGIIE